MMRKKPKLVLLTLHGMGEVEEGYHLPVQKGLAKRLGAQWADVSLQAVQYADIFQTPEDQLWHDIEAAPQNVLRWKEARQFFLFRFADATAFERDYRAILEKIALHLEARVVLDRKSTRLNSSHSDLSRMPSSA